MIRSRTRIAAKLGRIAEHIKHRVGFRQPSDYLALGQVERLRSQAKHDPEWKWNGFATEREWALHMAGIAPKREPNGRFDYVRNWERLCVCGHTLGVHAAGSPADCLFYSFPENSGDPCRCPKFRPSKRKPCEDCGEIVSKRTTCSVCRALLCHHCRREHTLGNEQITGGCAARMGAKRGQK